jgi:hypothetical protein
MNPTPETICAAIRDGSNATWSVLSRSAKPYLDTIMITADPKPTRACVRSPALLARTSRSIPINAVSSSPSSTGGRTAHWSPVEAKMLPTTGILLAPRRRARGAIRLVPSCGKYADLLRRESPPPSAELAAQPPGPPSPGPPRSGVAVTVAWGSRTSWPGCSPERTSV